MDAHHHGTTPGLAAPELAHHAVPDLPPLGTAAAHALVAPTSEKAPDAAIVGGPVQTETQCLIFEQPADEGKRFATLRAELALKGYSLSHAVAADRPAHYYVTRWSLVRELRDLAAVAQFLVQVGGADHG
jgi:hypothetical protein